MGMSQKEFLKVSAYVKTITSRYVSTRSMCLAECMHQIVVIPRTSLVDISTDRVYS